MMQKNYATINGTSISYTDYGPKDAMAVVFIHDFGLDKSMWESQQQFLSKDYRAIAFDVRGHGQSETNNTHFYIDMFASDLIGLLDYLDLRKVVLCGLSMGGLIALRTISLYPERVSGLILCETNSYSDNNNDKLDKFKQINIIEKQGITAFAAEMGFGWFNHQKNYSNSDQVFWAIETLSKNNPDAMVGTILALASRVDTSEFLKKINVPTLILAGEKDKIQPHVDAQYLNHFITGSNFCTIPNAWHLTNIENPEVFNSTLSGFLFTKFTILTLDYNSVMNKAIF